MFLQYVSTDFCVAMSKRWINPFNMIALISYQKSTLIILVLATALRVVYTNVEINMSILRKLCLGFYPSFFAYSHFPPKIQFLYCLFGSLSPWGAPMVGIEGKYFRNLGHQVTGKCISDTDCECITCTSLANMIFFVNIMVWWYNYITQTGLYGAGFK